MTVAKEGCSTPDSLIQNNSILAAVSEKRLKQLQMLEIVCDFIVVVLNKLNKLSTEGLLYTLSKVEKILTGPLIVSKWLSVLVTDRKGR